MGFIFADVVLLNGNDYSYMKANIIGEEEVRRFPVSILVDTGSYMLAINENIQEYLQVPILDQKRAELANGMRILCDVVGPIAIHFKNRRTITQAIVLPGDSEPLLGSIPLEDMDVVIHPLRQELIVNPESPDIALTKIKAKKKVVAP